MLFHVTHVHSPESCPAYDPKMVRKTYGQTLSSAGKLGIDLIGAYVDAPAHTVYFVIESDSVEKIEKFFYPVFKVGNADIRPVTNAADTVKRFS